MCYAQRKQVQQLQGHLGNDASAYLPASTTFTSKAEHPFMETLPYSCIQAKHAEMLKKIRTGHLSWGTRPSAKAAWQAAHSTLSQHSEHQSAATMAWLLETTREKSLIFLGEKSPQEGNVQCHTPSSHSTSHRLCQQLPPPITQHSALSKTNNQRGFNLVVLDSKFSTDICIDTGLVFDPRGIERILNQSGT